MAAIIGAAPPGSLTGAGPEAFTAWLEQIGAAYSAEERARIGKALAAGRARYGGLSTLDGEPWLDRALGTAAIVAGLKLDGESVRASILLGVPALAGFDAIAFAETFGGEV